jgi:hypothetical protein
VLGRLEAEGLRQHVQPGVNLRCHYDRVGPWHCKGPILMLCSAGEVRPSSWFDRHDRCLAGSPEGWGRSSRELGISISIFDAFSSRR